MINHAIGASGVVSEQCKTVVEKYGQTIIDLLLTQVHQIFILLIMFLGFICHVRIFHTLA